jgi:galactofuranosylgalactofuranosylrhamnosyl-N-acetylglucosaminyl-diphospho-decaprenol beta-1,5/1,6-galactofuranosyltransferase
VTDLSQAGVRVRRRDPHALRTLTRRTRKLIKSFRDDAPAVAQRYRDAMPELTSEHNWKRLFG